MRKTFDAELQELNYEMIDMAAAAEDAIDVVTESLASGDDAAAKSAVEMTRSMDQMERDIENRCLRLLLQQQPVARDLRTISAAMKMVTDLQRIGGTPRPPRLSLPWTTRWTPSSAPSRGSWWSSLQATGTRPTRPSTSSLSPSTWSASRITR